MTDQEILKMAINKAVINGFIWPKLDGISPSSNNIAAEEIVRAGIYALGFIFSHDFAKAFFGSKQLCICCERSHKSFSDCDAGVNSKDPEWIIRLRQMVISENPIKYLEKYL